MQCFLYLSNLRNVLSPDTGTTALHPDEAVYKSMLGFWAQQQRSLVVITIENRTSVIVHFGKYVSSYPRHRQDSDLDESMNSMFSKRLAISLVRQPPSATRYKNRTQADTLGHFETLELT